jgi:hypothetical protein
MKPFFWPGEVLALESIRGDHIVPGNVIAFRSSEKPDKVIVHRVVSVERVGENRRVVTRGDNARATDPTIDSGMVLGKVTGRYRRGRFLPVSKLEETLALVLSRWTVSMQRRPKVFGVFRRLGANIMTRLLKPRDGIVFRREGDDGVLFLAETGEVKLLNDTGAMIWELLEARTDRNGIIQRLADAFDISDRGALETDVDEFLEQIRRHMVEEEKQGAS